MPELPEVETLRRELEPRLTGRTIVESGSHWSTKFTPAVEAIDATIAEVDRRGKFLLLRLVDQRELIVHLGMTGTLSFRAALPDPDDSYLRAWWRLAESADAEAETLLFHDVRRFGRIRIVRTGDYTSIPTLHHAGPEPWDPALTPKLFHELIAKSRRAIKTQLLSQRPVAGVGNIYADEALWAAEINPRVTRLGQARAERLLEEVRRALEKGIDNGGTTLRDYRTVHGGIGGNQYSLAAYGRSGQPCLRCDTDLISAVIDARTTTWCPVCQRR